MKEGLFGIFFQKFTERSFKRENLHCFFPKSDEFVANSYLERKRYSNLMKNALKKYQRLIFFTASEHPTGIHYAIFCRLFSAT